MRTQKAITSLLVTAVLALGTVTTVRAADKKADPNGTWSWTMQGGRGGAGGGGGNANAPARKSTLKLKAEGDKLTGSLTQPGFRRGGQGGGAGGAAPEPTVTQISDGKVSGDEVSFTVKREAGGNTFSQKYSGKIDGDTIKGKIESERNGQNQSRDWEAKRDK